MTGLIFDIQRFCVHDGPGIRTTVFMKGCPLRCRWCHNPEGLEKEPQPQFFKEECIGCNRCGGKRDLKAAEKCPAGALKVCGREIDAESLLAEVLKDRDFYQGLGGVTFSGGECLLQADFVAEMLALLKREGICTAVDTCGHVPYESIAKTLENCDLYLFDVKCADPVLHKANTGAGNRLILENLRKLSAQGKRLWLRVPVIPGVNDNAEELAKIAEIAKGLRGAERVTLMPYHTLGKSKYETLGYTPAYDAPHPVTKDALDSFKALFTRMGLHVE